jgi:hypothetical protein
MKIKTAARFMFILFCVINTCIFLIQSLADIFFGINITHGGRDIIKVMGISLVSVLPVLLFTMVDENTTRKKIIVLRVLHFILTGGFVFAFQLYAGFMTAANAVYVISVFLIIYAASYITMEIRDGKLAKRLNERINAFHGDKNEAHRD